MVLRGGSQEFGHAVNPSMGLGSGMAAKDGGLQEMQERFPALCR